MANRKGGKLWSPGTLKSRGVDQGTDGPTAAPAPVPALERPVGALLAAGGRPGGRGHRGVSEKARGTAPQGPALQAAQKAAQAGAALLEQAWQAVSHPEDGAGTLAGYYHRAMVDHLVKRRPRGRGLRSSQVTGFLRQFLALETRYDGAQPGDLTHFVQAAVWMGANPKAPLTVQVLDRYPQVLWGAAEQAMEAFAQAQPEADGGGVFGPGRTFPSSSSSSRTLGDGVLGVVRSPGHPDQPDRPAGPEPQG